MYVVRDEVLPQLAREIVFHVVIIPVVLPELLVSRLFTNHLPVCKQLYDHTPYIQ